jgi:hypothetical protein
MDGDGVAFALGPGASRSDPVGLGAGDKTATRIRPARVSAIQLWTGTAARLPVSLGRARHHLFFSRMI